MPSSSSSSSSTKGADYSRKHRKRHRHRRQDSEGLLASTQSVSVVEDPNLEKQKSSNKKKSSNNNNNKKRSHRTITSTTGSSKRSYIDPAGVISTAIEDVYYDNERNPLTVVGSISEQHQQHQHQQPSITHSPPPDGDDDHRLEESELFDDTFTFLMAGKYPLDFCCKSKEETKSGNPQEDDFMEMEGFFGDKKEGRGMQRTEESTRTGVTTTTMNSLLDDVDPDHLCLPFWLGVFVITSQFFIYTVIIAIVFLRETIPPNADTWLRLAQVFAVIVTLYTQSDFIDGIFLITERWKAFREVTTPLKFNFSAILRVVAGNVGILSTLVLVLYSTEVVDLLLNFAAMEFVATLDNSAFEVAAKGFLGVTLEKKCLMIQEFRYKRRMRRGSMSRIGLYIFYVALVFGAFLTVVSLQATRSVGVDNEVYVQFDDTDVSELFGISGVYHGCQHFRSSQTGRIGYIDVGVECPDKILEKFPARTFLYCWDLEGYVYIDQETDSPCTEGNYLIRSFLDEASVASNSFDILTHAKANWVISGAKTKFGSESYLTNFVIDSVYTFQTKFKNCGEGSAGLVDFLPQSRRPYHPLEFSETFYPSEKDKFGDFVLYSDIFNLVYRPVYVRPICGYVNRYQMVLYDGLRWNYLRFNPVAYAESIGKVDECGVIQTTNEEIDCQIDYPRDSGCWKIFLKYFHSDMSWRSNYTVAIHEAISAPMIFLSPTDFGVPTARLTWFEPNVVEGRIEPGKPYEIVIVEDDDDDDDDFFNFGSSEDKGEVLPLFQCAASFDAACGDDEVQLTVTLTTDSFNSETRLLAFYGRDLSEITNLITPHEVFAPKQADKFTIEDNALTELDFDKAKASFILGVCVPTNDRCIQVLVGDTYGDGILTPGEFAFQYGDDPAVGDRSGDPFHCKSYHFGTGCADDAELAQGGNCNDVLENITKPEVAQDTSDNDFYDSSDSVPFSNTLSPESGGDDFFSIDTSAPTLNLFCAEDDEIEVFVQVTTDLFDYETSVLLFFGQSLNDISDLTTMIQTSVESRSGELNITEGALTLLSFEDSFTTYWLGSCIPSSVPCLQIVLLDSCGDGFSSPGNYMFSYGTEESVTGGGSGWGCRSYQFGSGCINTPQSIPSSCFGSEVAGTFPENVDFDSI